MKKFFADFRKFISRGNIVDLAIGVIVGNAFTAIVKALTDKIIMPLINFLLSLGGAKEGLASAYTFLRKVYLKDGTGAVDYANSIYIDWGAFITAILNFFIIAFTLFVVMKVAMKSNEFFKRATDKAMLEIEKNKLTKADKKILKSRKISIRDKEAVKLYLTEKQEIQKQKLAETLKQKEEEERKKLESSQEYLLKEIRDILLANSKNTLAEKTAEEVVEEPANV